MDCTTCDGEGIVYVEEGPSWWMGSGVFVNEYTCSDCGGTGTGLPEEPGPLCKHSQGPECRDCRGKAEPCCAASLSDYAAEGCQNDDHPLDPALTAVCEHGLSASLCAGPMHYPADEPDGPRVTISEVAATYHARGVSCPWDCAACDSDNVVDADV